MTHKVSSKIEPPTYVTHIWSADRSDAKTEDVPDTAMARILRLSEMSLRY